MASTMAVPRTRRSGAGRISVALARVLVVAGVSVALVSFMGHAAAGFLAEYSALIVTLNTVITAAYLGMGLLLIERRRGGAIGPLLLLAGSMYAIHTPFDLYLSGVFRGIRPYHMEYGDVAALISGVVAYPFGFALSAAMVLFPDGRPRSWPWHVVLILGLVGAVIGVIALTFGPASFRPVYPMFDSPFGIRFFPGRQLQNVADLTALAFRILAVASLVVRWRFGNRIVRAQTTWVLAVVVLSFAANILEYAYVRDNGWPNRLAGAAGTVTVLLLPIAMGVAIVRFHLFEIDRLVSRTIAYAAITAILGVTFVAASLTFAAIGGSLGLATVFGGIQMGETLSISMATLLVASSFGRVRRRVQRSVDRRFDRARYDGANTIAGLSQRLRGDVDLDSVRDDVLGVVDTTLHPVQRTLWLRPPRGARPTTP